MAAKIVQCKVFKVPEQVVYNLKRRQICQSSICHFRHIFKAISPFYAKHFRVRGCGRRQQRRRRWWWRAYRIRFKRGTARVSEFWFFAPSPPSILNESRPLLSFARDLFFVKLITKILAVAVSGIGNERRDDNNNNPRPSTMRAKRWYSVVKLCVCLLCVRSCTYYICWWRSMASRPHSSSSTGSQQLASQSKAGQRSLSQRINSRFTPAKFVCRKIYRGVNARKDEILWIKYIIFSPESSCFYVPFGDIRFYILFYFLLLLLPARERKRLAKKRCEKGSKKGVRFSHSMAIKIKHFMDFVTRTHTHSANIISYK